MLKLLSGLLSGLALLGAAAHAAPPEDIRNGGFVYCVSGVMNTFNPQLASSGTVVDTLSAQLYDRLLDVDPYTYRLILNWRNAGRRWITAPPTVFTCAVTFRSRKPPGLPRPAP